MRTPQVLEYFLSVSLQVTLLIAAAQWLARFARSDAARCRVWARTHAAVLVLAAAGLVLPHLRLVNPAASLSRSGILKAAAFESHLGAAVLLIWGIGATISLAAFLISWRRVQRFLSECEELNAECVPSGEGGLSAGGRTTLLELKFLRSGSISSPFCWQVDRPLVVLPDYLLDLPPEELKFIIRHELAHLRTGDPLALFLQRLVEVTFWFHPMVWWSSHQAALAREFACDAAAVESPAEIISYLKALLKIVERVVDEPEPPSLDLAFGRGKAMIARRAARLAEMARGSLSPPHSPHRPPTAAALQWVLIVLIGFVWAPIDVLASSRAWWSPWPAWSATVLHSFGVAARDYDIYDQRSRLPELKESLKQSRDIDEGAASASAP